MTYQQNRRTFTRALTMPTMTDPVRSVRQKQQRLSVPRKTGLTAPEEEAEALPLAARMDGLVSAAAAKDEDIAATATGADCAEMTVFSY